MDESLRALIAHRQTLLDRVRALLIEKLGVGRAPDEIDPDAPLFGLGLALDSIDAIELVVNLEAAFGVRLEQERWMAAMRTLGTLVDTLIAEGA